jgi:hypothetical protein
MWMRITYLGVVMKTVTLYLCLLIVTPALAASPAANLRKIKSVESPESNIVADFYFQGADAKRQIWLKSSASATDSEILYEYERDADVLFAPDERWIAINDHLSSDVSEIRLFKRVTRLKYSQLADADVTGKAWRFLAQQHGLPAVPHLDHTYSEVVRWAPNSRALMLVVFGHTDINQHIEPWTCIFELTSLQPSLDLSLMNRDAVHIEGKTLSEGVTGPGAATGSGRRHASP